jgi:hypothetical protein
MSLTCNDPTILALRRALDREAAALNAGECTPDHLVKAIFGCLPSDIFHPVFLPADGTSSPYLAISFKPAFRRYVTFAAEYWADLVQGRPPLRRHTEQC